ncbi:pyrokinin-1 receptor [Megachile rotundata]|uniref:pyrokinin-1 receptor n=1 Tax=Megachile rotundata TaxID=143995 RepID=UPI000614FE4B|nr:PREDICTED: neuropeptides capa receptor-like isoform X1 [Megachile rotundata]XP_012141145.1 PREDICTED: neuropeptides capa receptor-like isoform X2 [Megachile rotundata]
MEEPIVSTNLSNSTSIQEYVQDITNFYNGTVDNYFQDIVHPPRRDSLFIVVPVTIIYASIFVTGTIGNISTCIVIARNKSMHTATNYYLFSLAVSDLLLLVCGLPAEIFLVWYKYPYIFGEGFCVLRGLAAETSTNASVLTITAFTVERYVAICHPFLSQTMSKLTRAVKWILVIWLVALSFALLPALQFGVIQHKNNPSLVMCTVKRILLQHSFELSTFLFFVVPMSLITVLYVLIGLKLRKSNMMKRSQEREGSCRHHTGRSSRRVLKMLVAVVIAFFICWAPFHVQRLIAIYGTNSEDHITSNSKWIEFLYLLMTYISGVLYYMSTTINPILYNIMSNKFRVAFMETLSRSCRIPGLVVRNDQRSYSSLSRSQQRALGAYGSRTVGTGGTGIAHESTDCSGNSAREDSPKQTTALVEQLKTDSRNVDRKYADKDSEEIRKLAKEVRVVDEHRSTGKYATVKVSNVDEARKKWWGLLKWFPGLKSFKLAGRNTYTVSENRILKQTELHREEFSMSMWNVREANDQLPV